ncbi:MAG: N-acetylmuramoyl-L-alanine amidase [Verrucomicrobiales bacterium]
MVEIPSVTHLKRTPVSRFGSAVGGVGVHAPGFRLLLLLLLLFVAAPFPAEAARFRTVVIDAGHGGHDKGGSAGLIWEKHLALDVARRLEVFLRKKGIKTIMTRSRDNYISLPSRCYIANKTRDSIFVAIHFNSTSKRSVVGIETFYAGSSGKALGAQVQSRMVRTLHAEDRKLKYHRYYVLRNTKVPAILVECGFLSNSWERERSLQAWYRQLCAQAIGEGILAYR